MEVRAGEVVVECPTLVDILLLRSLHQQNKIAYTLLKNGEVDTEQLTFAELDLRARGLGALLHCCVEPGERALLLLPQGLNFIVAFFGCLYAGVVAVPCYPLGSSRTLPRIEGILRDSRPLVVLTTAAAQARVQAWLAAIFKASGPACLAVDNLSPGPVENWRRPDLRSETLAFLQYTSGSTSTPKGVMVSHGNLLHNERLIQAAFGTSENSVIVGWLPLFHDMGLIGNVLQPAYLGTSCTLMSPAAFLQQPRRWLEAISRMRATVSGGPDFAYSLCVRKIPPEKRVGLDLSSWSVAFNGSEPVRAETLKRFSEAFEPWGFRREAFLPCYGLAEATLFVSGGASLAPPTVASFEETAPAWDLVGGSKPETGSRSLVGCGCPPPGQRVIIADPARLTPMEQGKVGEIWIDGPSKACGYWGRPEETAQTFEAFLVGGEGPFLRTGDLGLLAQGELFVTGRLKDLIIVRGCNHYPQDIERTVESSHPALRPGGNAAFSLEEGKEERLVVVQELERGELPSIAELAEAVRRSVAEEHEVQLHELVLIRAGTLPKTSSGKVQRFAVRSALLSGTLEIVGRSTVAAEPDLALSLPAAEPGVTSSALKWLREQAALLLRVPLSRISSNLPLTALGFDSLTAIELKNEIEIHFGVCVPLVELLEGATLEVLASELCCAEPALATFVEPATAPSSELPVSYGQRALWLVDRLAPHSTAYHISAAFQLRSEFAAAAFGSTLQALVDRHPALRTTFHSADGEPFQRIGDSVTVDFTIEDVSGWDEARFERRLQLEAEGRFDLEAGPLFRIRLFTQPSSEPIILLAVHHIVCDYWSLAVMVRELGELYAARVAGRPAELPEQVVHFGDYLAWQKRLLSGKQGELLWAYWRDRLAGELPALSLPTDRPRPAVQTYRGASQVGYCGSALDEKVRELSSASGATLYVVLLTAFAALLRCWTGQEDLLIGSPTSGRSSAAFAGLVGYLTNAVVLRCDISGDPSFAELLWRVRRTVLDALAHQELPFALVTERLRPVRDPSRSPLFQTLFVLYRSPSADQQGMAVAALGEPGWRIETGGLVFQGLALRPCASQFDLTLAGAELDREFALSLVYNTDLFDAVTMARLCAHLLTLLQGAVAQPQFRVSELPLLSPAERHQLLREWDHSVEPSAEEPGIAGLFEQQAQRVPDREALVWEATSLTYGELNRQANRLANQLLHSGVGPEVPVAVCVQRSPEMVTALIAVLKAGGAYVPLEPGYPRERLRFILDETRAPVVLTEESFLGILPKHGGKTLCLPLGEVAGNEHDPRREELPQSLAYVIYTSGSTGVPKGVAIRQEGVLALLAWAARTFSMEEIAGVLASTSIGFDLSVFELFAPLTRGGTVILARNVLELPKLPAAYRVTLLNTVPSAMAELLRAGPLPTGLVTVNLAGEPLPEALVHRIYESGAARRVLNLYGPSEDTTYSTWESIPPAIEEPPAIGSPIDGTRAYLLDEHLMPVPIGVVGEVYLNGLGLARGYLRRPDLTAQSFLPDPFSGEPGARLYQTGDLACRLPDGRLRFLARRDFQVKVRGFRIELGEVEATLGCHPNVRDAVVVVREDAPAERRLVAYVVPHQPPAPAPNELRALLRQRLPDYMLPSAFITLEALPLTANGKLDRRDLPAMEATALDRPGGPPRTPTEEIMSGIWAELLNCEQVGREEDFFDLGGHSLVAFQLTSRLREIWGLDLSWVKVFEAPTVAALAQELERDLAGVPQHAAPPLRHAEAAQGPAPLSFAQQRLWILDQLNQGSAAYNLPAAVQLQGDLDLAALTASLNETVCRHGALRTRFPILEREPVQVVSSPACEQLLLIDLSGLGREQAQAEARRWAHEEARRGFDLVQGPLFRFALQRLPGAAHQLLLTFHHTVCDGWSLRVFARELGALYRAFCRLEASPLPSLAVDYTDYARWQRLWLTGEVLEGRLAFWREQLAGAPEALDLPVDRPRRQRRTSRGGVVSLPLSESLIRAVESLSRRSRATFFMTLLASWQALLSRMSSQDDLLIGTPVANRDPVETEGMVGVFTNTLVLRGNLAGDPGFAEFLVRVRRTALAAYEHRDLPFEQLVEDLRPVRDLGRSPLFQVLFALVDTPQIEVLPGLELTVDELDTGSAKFDLSLFVAVTDGRTVASLEYDRDIFDETTVRRSLDHWESLLRAVLAEPETRISQAPLLKPEQRNQMLFEWNCGPAPGAPTSCIHELVARQAARNPSAVALVSAEGLMCYGDLVARAVKLAARLRRLGAGPEVPVAVCVGRSPQLVVALLGILGSGSFYVPLDPAYPQERIRFLLKDTGVPLLLTEECWLEKLSGHGVQVVLLDEGEAETGGPEAESCDPPLPGNLAYILYTSGSSGLPKGVAIEHRNAVALLSWARDAFGSERLSGVLAATSICFDLSVFELFAPLAWGGRVVLADNALALASLACAGEVTLVNTVPSVLAALLKGGDLPPSVSTVNSAGEPLSGALAVEIKRLPGVRELFNLYGPSETTTYSTCGLVEDDKPTIGRPIAGSRIHILDRRLELVPVGVPGEIAIGGAGVARGYLNRPDLTAERFIPDPFHGEPGARLYRTGDLARYLADGQIDFLGRIDHQVKVRGFRIEPGEIEVVLTGHPAVRQAAVVAREDGRSGKELVAYVIADPQQGIAPGELRDYLALELPEHMLPQTFVVLPALPLTPNGKLDRRALPAPDPEQRAAEASEAARTPMEEVLAEIWAEVLGLERVGRHESFFALGGHSLLASLLISRIREKLEVQLPLRRLFEAPTVAQLARRLEAERGQAAPLSVPPIQPVRRNTPPSPSLAQERLWFLDRLAQGSAAYNIPAGIRFHGRLVAVALGRALEEVARRHEVLRTTFPQIDGRPLQQIQPEPAVRLAWIDLSGLSRWLRESEAFRLADQEARCPFELATGPLLRAALVRLSGEDHLLILNLHHIVADGWSLGVLVRDMTALYRHFSEGASRRLSPLKIQYADYAVWQRQWLASGSLDAQLGYWRDQLADAPAALDLPTDRPRAMLRGQAGDQLSLVLPLATTARLRCLARERGVTLFMALLAGFCALLHRYTRQEVLLVGSPIANRGLREIEPLIGLFANTLVMRGEVSSGRPFDQLVTSIRETVLDAHAHQDLPFERLVQELAPERSVSWNPLFQVMFVLQNALMPSLELPGLRAVPTELASGTAKFELTLSLADRGGDLAGSLEYNTWLFDRATAVRIVGHLLTLLEEAAARPETCIADLPLLGEDERSQLLVEWNQSRIDYPLATSTLHGLIEQQVKVSPEATAVDFEGDRLSYRDLDRKANRLAHALGACGVGPEMLVGICVERSLEMVWGLLGILKAGAAYLPLDPSYPRERLAFMLEDSNVPVLLTQRRLVGQLPEHRARLVILDDPEALSDGGEGNPGVPVLSDNLAYAIYTSGSTGRPKAALNTHGGIVNRLLWMQDAFRLTAADRVLQKTPFSFDVSVWEFFWPLLAGARLVVCRPDGHQDSAYLAQIIAEQGITTVHFVPSMLQVFLEEPGVEKCGCLRRLVASGETLSYEVQQRLFARLGADLYNLYGPTEAAVDVSIWACRRDDPRRIVPIGQPIANMCLYVLDPSLRPVPVGFVGELCIAGVGLGRGYLGRPPLTAERFVPHPFATEPGARVYRTGDLARFLPDGAIEFLGRIDHQVKLRGVRIELGEVESALCALLEVKSAVVLLREDARGEQRLVAYLIPEAEELPSRDELRARLGERLPQQMVPSTFVKLSSLPLLPNGKLDRRALPEPEETAQGAAPPEAPTNPVQEILAELFARTLGVAQVGIHEDFFALGGHSLLASRLASQIGSALSMDLPVGVLLQEPTVAGLTARLEMAAQGGQRWVPPIHPLPRGGQSPLSFAQQRLWFADHLEPGSSLYNCPLAVRFTGRLQPAVLERALLEIVRRHAILRTTFPLCEALPVQVVSLETHVALPLVDLSGLPAREREPLASRLSAEEARRPFDLSQGPLLRALLLRLNEQDHLGLLTLHHIVCDAWSLGILARELAALYEDFSAGRPSSLPQLALQYADFSYWQHERLQGEILEDHLQYWRKQLAGQVPMLRLPTDRLFGAPSSHGASQPFELPAGLARSLRELARQEAVTLFMVLLAAFKVLLYRYTGQEDLVVGADVANRIRPETEGLIGFFVNLLPLRSDLSGNPTFRELLHQVRRISLGAYAHQELPFDKLVEVLRPERSLGQTPLVRAILSFQTVPLSLLDLPDLQVTVYDMDSGLSKRDLTLFVTQREGELVGRWSYRTELFDVGTIARLSDHFETLLRVVVGCPETRLNALEFGLDSLRRQRAEEQRRHRQSKLHRLLESVPQDGGSEDMETC